MTRVSETSRARVLLPLVPDISSTGKMKMMKRRRRSKRRRMMIKKINTEDAETCMEIKLPGDLLLARNVAVA